MAQLKICSFCGIPSKLFYSNPKCCTRGSCLMQYKNQKHEKKESKTGDGARASKSGQFSGKIGYSTIKPKVRKATGEYKLFLSIYAQRNGKCEVTGELIPFNVNNFAHILSKGAYPRYRLNPDNILHIKPEIHDLYDNSDRKTLISKYPAAVVIYDKKQILRYQYYNE